MPVCNHCQTEKPSTDFYQSIATHCKVCWRARVKANRAAKLDQYRAYDRERSKRPDRVAARDRYASSEIGQARQRKAQKDWQDRNAAKRAAHIALGNAVRDGRISKPPVCEVCKLPADLHGHHEDYSKPLAVIWCCTSCHSLIHAYWRVRERAA